MFLAIKKILNYFDTLAHLHMHACARPPGVCMRPATLTSPLSHSPLIFPHLVLATATCLPGHLSYLRSCQKAEKIWEDFKNLAEPAFSRIILYDTFILYPKPQMFDFFFFTVNWGQQEA